MAKRIKDDSGKELSPLGFKIPSSALGLPSSRPVPQGPDSAEAAWLFGQASHLIRAGDAAALEALLDRAGFIPVLDAKLTARAWLDPHPKSSGGEPERLGATTLAAVCAMNDQPEAAEVVARAGLNFSRERSDRERALFQGMELDLFASWQEKGRYASSDFGRRSANHYDGAISCAIAMDRPRVLAALLQSAPCAQALRQVASEREKSPGRGLLEWALQAKSPGCIALICSIPELSDLELSGACTSHALRETRQNVFKTEGRVEHCYFERILDAWKNSYENIYGEEREALSAHFSRAARIVLERAPLSWDKPQKGSGLRWTEMICAHAPTAEDAIELLRLAVSLNHPFTPAVCAEAFQGRRFSGGGAAMEALLLEHETRALDGAAPQKRNAPSL